MRYTFGGRAETVIQDAAGNRMADWPVQVYSAIGGTLLTDLREVNGDPIASLKTDPATSASAGRIRRFRGPDEVTSLWYRMVDSSSREVWWPDFAHETTTSAFDAKAQAAQAAADAASVRADFDAYVNSDSAFARKDEVPSIEETVYAVQLAWAGPSPISRLATDLGHRQTPILVAAYPTRLLGIDFACNTDIPASDTNYWSFEVENASGQVIVAQDTRASSGGAITTRVGWSFDAQTFDPVTRNLEQGATLMLDVWGTGAPPELSGPMLLTVRYARSDA